MRKEHLRYLVCPYCRTGLSLAVKEEQEGRIRAGELLCAHCEERFPVTGFIPRFVRGGHYADSFGLQWLRHAKTQLDSVTGLSVSKQRFFGATGWPENLEGEVVLEIGGGAGRFTEIAANTGALTISFDATCAVDANYDSNGWRNNLLLVQADLENTPFFPASLGRVFCLGVLQHTANPRESFLQMATLVKRGGCLAVDIYKKSLWRYLFYSKYWVRPLTSRMNPNVLYALVRAWVHFWWPVTSLIARLPGGRRVNRFLFLIADYTGALPLPSAQLREWAVLDTFDMLSPRYDKPSSAAEVRRWFKEAGLRDIDVSDAHNIIEGKGVAV